MVQRLVTALTERLAATVPDRHCLIVTVTAPIRKPAATAAQLGSLLAEAIPGTDDLRDSICGNRVQARRATGLPLGSPRLLVFVHSPHPDAPRLLDRVQSRVSERGEGVL